jgi:hypothetical protein
MVDTILTDDASALQAARTLLDQVPALGLMVSLLDDDPAVVYELAKGGPYVPLSAGALRLVIVMSAGDQPLIHAHVDTWSIRTATDPAHPAKRLTLTVWGFAARQDPTRIELPDVEAIRAVPTPLSALLRPGGNTGPIT